MARIREPVKSDVPAMLDLAEARREEYQRYQPTFWRKAGDSRERQRPYLERLISEEHVIARVYESDGVIEAFIIGALIPAPPVYDPGGPICLVDDFAIRDEGAWEIVGAALLDAVTAEARRRGAVLVVVIAGRQDQPRRALLTQVGYDVASEWHIRHL
jgi:hypothetical protein